VDTEPISWSHTTMLSVNRRNIGVLMVYDSVLP